MSLLQKVYELIICNEKTKLYLDSTPDPASGGQLTTGGDFQSTQFGRSQGSYQLDFASISKGTVPRLAGDSGGGQILFTQIGFRSRLNH